ncbi:NADH:ubiquinone oxidoreductase [Coniosporium tulheliwenetii]|uniref:NADH:ubiquinone oxidoreductase n=1 Tax=Coniosporium tulheliwenetii TaxID=3383036 RepID=A0ACC2ZD00_9PEZI|nr:NADH:ubiquinone oxidoreductase [Cladosporium sp. JES 115]
MTSAYEPPSSPAVHGSSLEEELAYYKAQYEQLEVELQEFQASSRELEAELEKDVEASEKRERQLKEKVEGLGFEVEEWKAKYKQSKTEAASAQNTLQKEITILRDANRTLQLKLRDIEVANDDFERQARNTTSSLEDLESKYNVAIERGVMLEEEMKANEQERESLRIETQRLRDELSDLKIEAEIVQGKLRHAEATVARQRDNKVRAIKSQGVLRPHSPVSEASTSATTLSSPTASTPPPLKSDTSSAVTATPPSPPLSDASLTANVNAANLSTPLPTIKKPPSLPRRTAPTPSAAPTPTTTRQTRPTPQSTISSVQHEPPTPVPPTPLPRSGSLYQIRGLIGKMQKLEQRVHSARSKLPAPSATPERASPNPRDGRGSALGHHVPSTVTVRSSRKRVSGSTALSMSTTHTAATDATANTNANAAAVGGDTLEPRKPRRAVSRLSFGHSARASMSGAPERSASRLGTEESRPSSRASVASFVSNTFRPSSRSSMSGARTPLLGPEGPFASTTGTTTGRPGSGMGGVFGHGHGHGYGHGHSASISVMEESDTFATPTLPRHSAVRASRDSIGSATPTPSALPRRKSGGVAAGVEP